jgi:cytoskeletal protein RodZ
VTLGQIFREKRLASGRSLEQLAALTKIHIKILTALEADSYSALPARAFTRGFIVNYAKALKLDPEQILKDHHDFLEQHFQERKDRDQGHQGYVFEGKELEQNRRWMTIGATVAIVFAAATLFIFKPQNHKHKEIHKEFQEETALDADGDPVEAPMPPPTLKDTPSNSLTMVPWALPSASPVLSSTNSATSSAKASVSPLPIASLVTTSATSHASPTVAPTVAPTAAPTTAPTVAPTAAPTATPRAKSTPAPSASPVPSSTPEVGASPTPAAKTDSLNKGDNLSGAQIKLKITFQSKDDLYVRYQSDDRPVTMIILRKGRFLVIKASTHLAYETAHPEFLRYKTKGAYQDLTLPKGEVNTDATLTENSGANLGNSPVPEDVPPPPQH